ncbi:MAG: S41 family peptidase [Defluviitaleaceae bacterium]|nr:S41 family peptidase [Defluviitaleaceae bacterium]
MGKKLLIMVALALVLIIALPTVASARRMDDITHRIEGGMVYVPLRQAAEAYGWEVTWERRTGIVHLTNPSGVVESYPIDFFAEVLGGFIEEGVTWIPYEVALMMFDTRTMVFTLTEEARDIALYDFDYMIAFILENSPWDNVIYRALGIEFGDIVDFYRNAIESMEPLPITIFDEEMFAEQFPVHDGDTPRELAANYLFMLLNFFAMDLTGIGHMMPRLLDIYTAQYTAYVRGLYHEWHSEAAIEYAMLMHGVFEDPAAVWFYGEIEVDVYDTDSSFPRIPGNVETEILVPDEIALIRINSFMANSEYDDAYILPFLREVSDFDHLIIDIRGNFGGLMYYPLQLLFRRLINEPVYVNDYEFFADGETARSLMEAGIRLTLETEGVEYAEILPAGDFVAERGKVLFGEDALARLDHVMVSRVSVEPAIDAVGFEGRIWLLVDGFSASTSAMFTLIALETGFATVVGENTSRIMGSSHVYIVLPNTGIIWRTDIGYRTDAYGRSLEVYGIAPNQYNFEGMDALDTVLAIILG